MTAAVQDIRRGRKFAQVLEGARAVFLRDGFDGASVDDIARAAGVSKATLYAYFPDKRLLFVEVAKEECRRQAEDGEAQVNMDRPVAEVLLDIARRVTAFAVSDFGQRVFRICMAESDRFPAVAQEFWQSGPGLVRDKIAGYLRHAAGRGELALTDAEFAADQFAALCKAGLQDRLAFRLHAETHPPDPDRVAREAVAMFLARYGVR
jgi:AcrR family transcriptional regulator